MTSFLTSERCSCRSVVEASRLSSSPPVTSSFITPLNHHSSLSPFTSFLSPDTDANDDDDDVLVVVVAATWIGLCFSVMFPCSYRDRSVVSFFFFLLTRILRWDLQSFSLQRSSVFQSFLDVVVLMMGLSVDVELR